MSKAKLPNPTGEINKLEVRCPCGVSCENVATYLEHKRDCNLHAEQKTLQTIPSNRKQEPTEVVASLPDSASPPKPVGCSCGRRFKTRHALQQHTSSSAAHKQQAELPRARQASDQLLQSRPATASTPATQTLGPTAVPTTKDKHCTCGKTFPNAKKLQHHLRYSKAHARTNGPSSRTAAPRPSVVQIGPPPGTIPASMLSTASFLHCTCGGRFETERVLALHKRDWHRRGIKTETREDTSDAFLAASLAGLKLDAGAGQTQRSGGPYSCRCGDGFASQAELDRHRQIMGRCAWPEGGGLKTKKFKTPRPAYQKDEYLEDGAMLQKLQYASVT